MRVGGVFFSSDYFETSHNPIVGKKKNMCIGARFSGRKFKGKE